MTDSELDEMRENWRTVAAFKRGSGEWSAMDEQEFGEEVREALRHDETAAYWAVWLQREAEWIRRFTAMVRAAEARIRAEQAERRVA